LDFAVVQAEKVVRGRESDKAAGVEKSYALAEEQGFANVVGDEDDGSAQTAN
jgi:hypothetical protein